MKLRLKLTEIIPHNPKTYVVVGTLDNVNTAGLWLLTTFETCVKQTPNETIKPRTH